MYYQPAEGRQKAQGEKVGSVNTRSDTETARLGRRKKESWDRAVKERPHRRARKPSVLSSKLVTCFSVNVK